MRKDKKRSEATELCGMQKKGEIVKKAQYCVVKHKYRLKNDFP